MTPEERAVINTAIAANDIGREPSTAQLTVLRQAVHKLIFACPKCNAGGHTCPGDGNPIGHADSDCGDHDDDAPREDHLSGELISATQDAELDRQGREMAAMEAKLTEMLPPGFSAEVDQRPLLRLRDGRAEDPPEWITRTWVDVRAGDRVRLPGTEHVAVVESVVALPWHVHPAADPYRPNEKPAEWTEIKVRLAGRPGLLSMSPAAPIEIELTASELATIEALGWENRVRQLTSE